MYIFKAQVTTMSFGEWCELIFPLSELTMRLFDPEVDPEMFLESP
jgi:hypothetical protein